MEHEFERLLAEHRAAVESYIRYRLPIREDADDVWQETCIAAMRAFGGLRDRSLFKPWLLTIAKNKCRDYFRHRARVMEIPVETLRGERLGMSRRGITAVTTVRETMEALGGRDQQILYLYYFRELPQSDIASRLGIPLGTVKSRLHSARESFRQLYPYPMKGDDNMRKLPERLPDYTIKKSDAPVFSVKWEEMMGWFIVPREGEKLAWAIYDRDIGAPGDGRRGEYTEMEVGCPAEVHSIGGVEITAREYEPMDCNATGANPVERRFVAQLTDTHCRILAESHMEGGVRRYFTFLDGSDFLDNWGFGDDNIGNETMLTPKGDIIREGDRITAADKSFLLDVVGRYAVTIGGRTFDTVCVMDIETYNSGVASEQFIDQNGRTILWRRFNRDNWAESRYGRPWSQLLPRNERIYVNGELYVHWYDCITDYIYQ